MNRYKVTIQEDTFCRFETRAFLRQKPRIAVIRLYADSQAQAEAQAIAEILNYEGAIGRVIEVKKID